MRNVILPSYFLAHKIEAYARGQAGTDLFSDASINLAESNTSVNANKQESDLPR